MKILVVCEQGNNRSVTIASNIKYWGHDVLSAGTKTNSLETIKMLMNWADKVIITESTQAEVMDSPKTQLWDIGPDIYPRPYNRQLYLKVRKLMAQHELEFKQVNKEFKSI